MNSIEDMIENISLSNLKEYLISNGWSEKSQILDKALVLVYKDSFTQVVLPLRKSLGDFRLRTAELLRALETIESRSINSIFHDINHINFDVVRIKIKEASYGTISLLTNTEIINGSKEMFLAAASSTENPKKIYSSKKSETITKYINSIRSGQTEIGSYIFTLLCPIPSSKSKQLPLFTDIPIEEDPFERKVTRTLLKSLHAIKDALSINLNNHYEIFEEYISSGVSANFCEALSYIIKNSYSTEIDFTWAKTLPNSSALGNHLFFENKDAEVLSRVAEHFKTSEPIFDQIVIGRVYKLCQEPDDPKGTIHIKTILNDKTRTIKVTLSDEDYHRATIAHGDKKTVQIQGQLHLIGRLLELREPKKLIVEE